MDSALKDNPKRAEIRFYKVDERTAGYKQKAVGLLKGDEVRFAIEPSWIPVDVFEFDKDDPRIGR